MKLYGYLHEGKFYQSLDELMGRTFSQDNQPIPLYDKGWTDEDMKMVYNEFANVLGNSNEDFIEWLTEYKKGRK